MSIELFDYQQAGEDALRAGVRQGFRRQMFYLATGGGKSVLAMDMIRSAVAKGTRCLFIVDRVALVAQFSRVLHANGIAHGIIQGNHPGYRPYELVQVASAQTLERRPTHDFGLVFVDEAHVRRKRTEEIIAGTSGIAIGLSATPFTRGLGTVYGRVVGATTTNALIERGRLAPLRVFEGTPTDLSGVGVTAGEWRADEAAQRGTRITADVVREWVAKVPDRPQAFKTMVFSATVDHGAELVRDFAAAGLRFEQISYRDGNMERRDRILAELNDMASDLCGVISCEALGRGVDIPNARCLVLCRPYRKSFAAHIQQLGRGMRSAPGKDYCVVLDHVGNCARFWGDMQSLFDAGCTELDSARLSDHVRSEPTERERKEMVCSCGALLYAGMATCPNCGRAIQPRRGNVVTVAGSMVERGAQAALGLGMQHADKVALMGELRQYAAQHGKPYGWIAHRYRDRVGAWPDDPAIRDAAPREPGDRTLRWLRYMAIRYAKRRA